MRDRVDDFACQLRDSTLHLLKGGDIDGSIEYPLLLPQTGHEEWNAAALGIRLFVP